MLKPYDNENNDLPAGSFQWVPPIPKDGKASFSGSGFNFLSIDRGQFRNDVPKDSDKDTRSYAKIAVSYKGKLADGLAEESRNYPFWAAFRRKRRPTWDVGTPPVNTYFKITADKDGFIEYEIDLGSNASISAISIEYALNIDPKLDAWANMLADPKDANNVEDQKKFDTYVKNGYTGSLDIDWRKYHPMQIVGLADGSEEEKELPILANDKYQAMAITGLIGSDFESQTEYTTFSFNLGGISFPTIRKIRIKQRKAQYKNLSLMIKRILVFNNARVNLRKDHYPAQAFGYTALLQTDFMITQGQQGGLYPTISPGRPLVYFKMFQPEDLNASLGFAHAIDVRFLIVAVPVFLLGGDVSSLAGLMDAMNNPRAYLAINVGPRPGKRQIRYAMDATLLADASVTPIRGYTVNLDREQLMANVFEFEVQRGEGTDNTQPQSWEIVATVQESDTNYKIEGPLVSRYLFLDASLYNNKAPTSSNLWYRINQRYRVGSAQATRMSSGFKPSLYPERSPLRMAESSAVRNLATSIVSRRIKNYIYDTPKQVLDAAPLAVFMADDSNHPANTVEFMSGIFNAVVTAYTDDKNAYANTHLVLRFWFHPENVKFDNANPHEYRDVSEFVFAVESNGDHVIKRSSPQDLSQVMITPALSNDVTTYSINKFVEAAIGENVSKNVWTMPSEFMKAENTLKRARLVVGVYAVSVPNPNENDPFNKTPDESPKLYLEIAPEKMNVTTTIGQTLSGDLFPVQPNLFEAVKYENIGSPLYLSKKLFSGADLSAKNDWYIYNDSVAAPTTDSRPTALNKLVVFGTKDEGYKFAIPYNSVPLRFTGTTRAFADFVTDHINLTDGRVMNGKWAFSCKIDEDKDTAVISYKYQFEAFLVNTTGRLMNYVVRSDYLDAPKYETEVNLPYSIEEDDVHLVVRFSAYPFSKSGNPVDLAVVKTDLGDKPVGVRFSDFTLSSHTVQSLAVTQSDSFRLSKASFEGLPIVPSRTFGGNRFWVDLEADTNQQVIIANDPDYGYYRISARLFSPTWLVSLPKDMEIQYSSTPYTGDVRVRTALGSSATEDVALTGGYNKDSKQIYVAQSVDEDVVGANTLAQTGKIIQFVKMNSPEVYREKQFASGFRLGTGGGYSPYKAQGNHPSLILNSRNKNIQLVTEVDEVSGPSTSIINNRYVAGENTWDNNSPISSGKFGEISRLATDITYPTIIDMNNGYYCIVGWLNTGFVAAKFVNLNLSSPDGVVPAGQQIIIDGSGEVNDGWVFAQGAMKIPVPRTPLGCAVNEQQKITVAYPLEGKSGSLYIKSLNGLQSVGYAREVVSFSKAVGAASNSLDIRCPSLTYDSRTGVYYCVFWCSGKLFVTQFTDANTLVPLTLVAGTTDFTSTSNKAHSFFAAAQNAQYLVNRVDSADTDDVPSQKATIVIPENMPHNQNNVFVFYKNSRNEIFSRKVSLGLGASARQPIN